MSTTPIRRLAAILIADIAGYSGLMERDEQGTHERLARLRAEVTDPAIAQHHGRFVRSKGDDLLVEFASAVEALSCAIQIQRMMADCNGAVPREARMQWRIGINLGDILVDGNDIAGDGVNVAARLQAMAEPGGIALSAAVREQVRQVTGVQLVDAGEHRFKNISRPIRVYRVGMDGGGASALPERVRSAWSRWRGTTLVALLALAAAGLWAGIDWSAREPPRQSLAVLPFKADDKAAATAAALAETATNTLGQMLNGNVASPSAAARAAELAHEPERLGRRLQVRYLLEGEVGVAGDEVRLNARLVSSAGGRQLWASTLSARRQNGETVPLEVIGQLVNRVVVEVRRAELAHPRPGPPDPLDLVLRAFTLMPSTETTEQLRDVRRLFEQALELEPERVDALAGVAMVLAYESERVATVEEGRLLLQRASDLSLRAIGIGAQDAEAWRARAVVLQMQEHWSAAELAIDRALAINPFGSEAQGQRGSLLVSTGRSEEALIAIEKAIRLNPDSEAVGVHLNLRCRALLYLERYAAAIESCTRATAFAPDWPDYMLLAAAYALNGEPGLAAQARDELLRREPRFTVTWFREKSSTPHPRTFEQREKTLVAGLRKAGVPER